MSRFCEMDFFGLVRKQSGLDKPFSKATGPELVHENCFLGALKGRGYRDTTQGN